MPHCFLRSNKTITMIRAKMNPQTRAIKSTIDSDMPTMRAHLRSSDSVDFEHTATMKDMEELTFAEKVLAHLVDV